jgi:hypothetical protein
MREVVEIVALSIVAPLLAYRLVVWDEGHLRADQLERAWPRKTRTSAVVGMSLLLWPWAGTVALIVHFGRTRRTLQGVAVGFAWAAAVFVAVVLLVLAIDELPMTPQVDWAVLGLAVAVGLYELVTRWKPWLE